MALLNQKPSKQGGLARDQVSPRAIDMQHQFIAGERLIRDQHNTERHRAQNADLPPNQVQTKKFPMRKPRQARQQLGVQQTSQVTQVSMKRFSINSRNQNSKAVGNNSINSDTSSQGHNLDTLISEQRSQLPQRPSIDGSNHDGEVAPGKQTPINVNVRAKTSPFQHIADLPVMTKPVANRASPKKNLTKRNVQKKDSTWKSQGSGHSTAYLFNSSGQVDKRFSIARNTVVLDRCEMDRLLPSGQINGEK